MKTFSVVGTGRLGTSLAQALVKKRWMLLYLADKNIVSARDSRKAIGQGKATAELNKIGHSEDVVFITVPDEVIFEVSFRLAQSLKDVKDRIFLHTSGMHPSSILNALKEKKAAVGCLHPIQSFAARVAPPGHFKGIFWDIEGDKLALSAAREIVRLLGGHCLMISSDNKIPFHLAWSLASNGLVYLESAVLKLLQDEGLDEKTAWSILRPLVVGTINNAEKFGLRNSLSGPLIRGDVETLARHLERLGDQPELKKLYIALLRQAIQHLPLENSIRKKPKLLKLLAKGK